MDASGGRRSLAALAVFALFLTLVPGCLTGSVDPPEDFRATSQGALSSGAERGGASAAPRWGAAVPSARHVREVQEVLSAIAAQGARSRFADLVGIGPLLWREVGHGPLADVGIHMLSAMSFGGRDLMLPSRMLINEPGGRGDMVDAFLRDASWRAYVARFAGGRVRAATEAERAYAWPFIGFEIAGRPVTVVEFEGGRLVFFFDESNKIRWLDLQRGGDASEAINALVGEREQRQVGLSGVELSESAELFEQNLTARELGDWIRRAGAVMDRVLAPSPVAFSGRLALTLRHDAPSTVEVLANNGAPRALIEQLSAELRGIEPPRTRRDELHCAFPFRVLAARPAPQVAAGSEPTTASAPGGPAATTGDEARSGAPVVRRRHRRRATP